MGKGWICSQLGAREHYLTPRALKQHKEKVTLITDFWVDPSSLINKIYPKARSRYHYEIHDIPVYHFNKILMPFQALFRNKNLDKAYDKLAAEKLKKICGQDDGYLFCTSYSSLNTLKQAKKSGLKTFYAQINPGPEEAELVKHLYRETFGNKYEPNVPDQSYWEKWYEETSLADHIIANSEWSKKLLIKAGISASKISVIPLAYEGEGKTINHKSFRDNFSYTHPLRLLYLGAISIRKGFHVLKNAMAEISQLPIKLDVVGRLNGPQELLENLPSNVTYHGEVSPFETDQFYRNADIFILPTFSDGFALTQLEAQSYKLPLITSPFCASVITHKHNGWVMPQVNIDNIREACQYFLDNPDKVSEYSSNTVDLKTYSVQKFGERLLKLAND